MEKEADDRVFVYHQTKSPNGTTFKRAEAEKRLRKGWVDTPAKFGKGLRGKWYNFVNYWKKTIKKFWCNHWQWIINTVIFVLISIIGLYLAWLQVKN